MVKPSAHASHILVASKSEAFKLEKIGKLKDFEKLARKKSTCPSSQRGGDLGWFRKGTWFASLRRQYGARLSKRFQHRSKPNLDTISYGFMNAMRSERHAHLGWLRQLSRSWCTRILR